MGGGEIWETIYRRDKDVSLNTHFYIAADLKSINTKLEAGHTKPLNPEWLEANWSFT